MMIRNPEQDRIRVVNGSIPVLISAPHTRPIALHSKDGGIITKPAELKIARLLRRVCRQSGAWGIYMGGPGPLQQWEGATGRAYKRTIRELIERHGIALFIELHGSMEARPFTVDYDFKISKRKPYDAATVRLEHIILKHLTSEDMGAPISKTFFSKENGVARNTLTYYVRRRFDIAAVQFEINKVVRENPEIFQKLNKALYNIVMEWEAERTAA